MKQKELRREIGMVKEPNHRMREGSVYIGIGRSI